MEERPPIWTVAANILNEESRTADKGWSYSLGVGRGANNSSSLRRILLRNIHRQHFGPGLITLVRPKERKRDRRLVFGADNKMENNDMGGACTSYGGGERRVQCFGGET